MLGWNETTRKAPKHEIKLDSEWSTYNRIDKIRNNSYQIYSIKSLNSFELKFPYDGLQYASIDLVKYQGEWTSAAFMIERGIFACKYDFTKDNPCIFKVKFGNSSVKNFVMQNSPDNTDQIKIFKNSKKFIDELLKVNGVIINEAGVHQFEFKWQNMPN